MARWCTLLLFVVIQIINRKIVEANAPIHFDGSLDICYLCDKTCQTDLRSRWGNPRDLSEAEVARGDEDGDGVNLYLQTVTEKLGEALSVVDSNIKTVLRYVFTIDIVINLQWFNGNEVSEWALPMANMGLWGNLTGAFETAQIAGCDIALGIFADSPTFAHSEMDSVSTMFQVCSNLAFGIVKLDANDFFKQVAITAHEVGHILGMYDDGIVGEAFKGTVNLTSAAEPSFSSLLAKLNHDCHGQAGCTHDECACSDPSGRCFMAEDPIGEGLEGNVFPSMYSNCSIANYKMIRKLQTEFPHLYPSHCFQTALVEEL